MSGFDPLLAISPLDGRYRSVTEPLADYFSEFALIRARLWVECQYYLALAEVVPQLQGLSEDVRAVFELLPQEFGLAQAQAVKAHEQTTRHDVKALEYFMKDQLARLAFYQAAPQLLEFIHFGLTSQDINNTATPHLLKGAIVGCYLPRLDAVLGQLNSMAQRYAALPMLARTHGQPASPTTLGKELAVFASRLATQRASLVALPYPAKFGGATGGFNAHYAAYPGVDWQAFADRFVARLGLQRSRPTTQIEHYDGLAAIFDNLRRINVILIDLARDVWQYIALGYFRQPTVAGEIGSSAMPHKVNPIDFENAEGNLGLANALLDHLSNKLPISRLQRDLTDSTVLRNLGVPLGHTYLALRNLEVGLGKLAVNEARLHEDLEANWAVVAEGIQTILRREGYPKPYEALLALTRGAVVDQAAISAFIDGLEVPPGVKAELRALTPFTYLGRA
ncbi:MAG: adenylosuccinate lyase [Bacteroidia bacterium]|nr:adenylosuccinate lyase [Bacteroidia bacterium]